ACCSWTPLLLPWIMAARCLRNTGRFTVVLVVVKSIAGALEAHRVFLQARHARAVRLELDAQQRVGATEPGVGLVIGQGVGLARAGQPAVGAAQAQDLLRVYRVGLEAYAVVQFHRTDLPKRRLDMRNLGRAEAQQVGVACRTMRDVEPQ